MYLPGLHELVYLATFFLKVLIVPLPKFGVVTALVFRRSNPEAKVRTVFQYLVPVWRAQKLSFPRLGLGTGSQLKMGDIGKAGLGLGLWSGLAYKHQWELALLCSQDPREPHRNTKFG